MQGEGVVATLRHGWVALEPLQIPMAVIGGLALSAWNHARYTRDADILIGVDDSNVDAVLTAVVNAGFRPKHHPPILQIDDQRLIQLKFVPPEGILPFQLDLLFAGSEYQKTALARRTSHEIPDLDRPVDVLRPEDLILLKLLAGRIIDRFDAATLLRENRDVIDFPYLQDWVKRQKFDAEYAEIWQEAFPGEPLPA